MFCYQCEQTGKGTGCEIISVCGKDPTTAALQDLLFDASRKISVYAYHAQELGATKEDLRPVAHFVLEALFTTVTNVNFDPARMKEWLVRANEIHTLAKNLYAQAAKANGQAVEPLTPELNLGPETSEADLIARAALVGILVRKEALGDTVAGLQELVAYGLKGAAAYAEHARMLDYEDDDLYASFLDYMSFLAKPNPTVAELVERALGVGALNFKVMELLDRANTETYGHPTPTPVKIRPVKGKAIVVSGHDLRDLYELLEQTKDKGINIYTHGEMLPAHGYPKLKAFPHLVGNYGGAWQDQAREFDAFPGAILMTTNCIQKPRETYLGRIFTSGIVAWPGVVHIKNRDFTPVIEAALSAPGFTEDAPNKTILVGFGHNAVLSVADKVIDGVKSGAIKRFILVGGCDGAKSGRNYYTDITTKAPKDTIILTLACGKYRFNKKEFGQIDGIPRLLDIGQCNDTYSAIQIAVALAKAFGCGVNDLPLSMVLSWYEQKAVAVLLTLLHLGIKNIRLGPSLPAFVTPEVLSVLVEGYNIMPITTADADLQAIMAGR